MNYITALSTSLAICMATATWANELDKREKALLSKCENYMEKNDRDSAKAVLGGLASKLRSRDLSETDGDFLDYVNKSTQECVEFAFGVGARYYVAEGKFLNDAGLKEAGEKKIQQEAQRQFDEELEQLEKEEKLQTIRKEAARKRNKERVAQKVFEACVKLASDDEIAAFTNQLCVNSFMVNGLPDRF
ncbi:hypothetical protein PH7735_00802 [Shimia thalassica]|uniref:Uncharacterized protein n=1 Tax=Shimia thalassica TaxID=1715693 RepID=A0A0N7M8H1_9RHOB|nr:hypothetical protein [Shimia thalassica]CUJ87683.1 hypothetical protein PH7735_00802 [Shimia thalassica]